MARRIALIIALLVAACWIASYWRIGTDGPMGTLTRVQLVDGAVIYVTKPMGNSRILFNGSQRFLRTLWWTDRTFTGASMTIGTVTIRALVLPLWLPLLGAVLASLTLPDRKSRERKRLRRGLCAKCAYPIGASDVCTECGAALPDRVQA